MKIAPPRDPVKPSCQIVLPDRSTKSSYQIVLPNRSTKIVLPGLCLGMGNAQSTTTHYTCWVCLDEYSIDTSQFPSCCAKPQSQQNDAYYRLADVGELVAIQRRTHTNVAIDRHRYRGFVAHLTQCIKHNQANELCHKCFDLSDADKMSNNRRNMERENKRYDTMRQNGGEQVYWLHYAGHTMIPFYV